MVHLSKATTGVKWLAICQIGRQFIQLISNICLARLVAPSDFGLVSMALVMAGSIAQFKDLGTSAAVIQRKSLSQELLSSIFFLNVAFGLLAMAVFSYGAFFAATFYHDNRIIPLLKVLSVTFLISSVGIVPQALMERKLAFQELAKIELSASVSGALVGISSALAGAGAWSLVYQYLATTIVTTFLLWVYCSWRPRIIFRWLEIKTVRGYSLNLTVFSIFNYLTRNGDYLLIGRYLGAEALGYYTLAYRIMLYPLGFVSSTIGRFMFPVYSQLQDDEEKMRYLYLKAAGAIAFITFPMMLGLLAVTKLFILTIFGPKWVPVIILVKFLAPIGMAQSIETTAGNIFQAKGRTDLLRTWGIISGVVVVTSFVIGLGWGILGVAIAYALATALLLYPSFAFAFSQINLPVKDLGKELRCQLLCSIIMFGLVLGLQALIPANFAGMGTLAFLVLAGIGIYLLASWFFNREQYRQVLVMMGRAAKCS